MKKLLTLIAAGAFAFIGTSTNADARPYGGHGYHGGQSTVYVSGYRHGRPVYTEKIYVGRDRCGQPIYRYRTVAAPRHRGYHNDRGHCAPVYRDRRDRHHYSRNERRHHSGSRVSFSFGF